MVRRPVSCLRNYAILQTSMQSILDNIFVLGLLRLSAGTDEVIALTAAAVVSH